MVYYPRLKLSDRGVAYAVASLLLEDARVNHLMLKGFPSVLAKLEKDTFIITLEENGRISQPLTLSIQEAKRLDKKFQDQKLTTNSERVIFDKLQDVAANFEGYHKNSN